MNYFSIDYLIVYTFLAVTLMIGIRAGRGVKNIREYAIANRSYGTLTLLLTFLATNIGSGSVVQATSGIFSEGMIRTVATLGVSISLLFIASFIAPRITKFENCFTIGDVMKISYGKLSQLLAGVLGVFYSVAMISMQLLALGIIFNTFLQVDTSVGIIIDGLILTIYSAYGGIKSVTITDVFQFIILIIVFPLMANIVLKYTGGLKHLLIQLPPAKVNIFSHKNFSYYFTLFLVWSIFPVGITSPPLFQRMLMAKNANQLQHQYFIAAGFDPIFQILIMLIGLSGIILYPSIEGNNLLPHLIQDLLPIGAKGVAIAGLLAVVMSTADSYLNSAGIVFVHDILKPIYDKYGWEINELKYAKYGTLCIGIAGIIIALKSTNMLGLSFLAVKFTGPLLMFPLLAGILGLKPDKQTFYLASVVTLMVFLCSNWLLPKAYDHLTILISILANAFTFTLVHFIQNRGLAIVNHSHPTIQINTLWQPRKKTIFKKLQQLLPTPARIVAYSRNKVEKYGASYTLFGIFCAINYLAPYFMWNHEVLDSYNLMLVVRIVGFLLCTLLILREKWPKSWLHYLPTFWHLTVLYCLPFSNTILFLTTSNSIEQIAHISITAIFLVILLDWMSFLLLSILGAIGGFWVVQHIVGNLSLQLDFSTRYFLIYQLIFITLIGLLFVKHKPKAVGSGYIADRFAKTLLGEQIEFILGATKRLAGHLDMYMENTEKMWWNETHDGFYTIYSHGMQTIEDPDLFELLVDVLPSIKAMRDETKSAVQILRASIKSKMIATNLHLDRIKALIVDGICEIKIDGPSYSCTIYQITHKNHLDPIVRIVTIKPSEQHLHIHDYSEVLTETEKMPLLQIFSAIKTKHLTVNSRGSYSYFEAIQQRIAEIQEGYKTYTLEFPNMELVA